MLARIALVAALASTASAHYHLTTPLARGFNSAVEATAPCGGYNDVDATRIFNFPITGGSVTLSIEDGDGTMSLYYSSGKGSTNFVSLNSTTPYTSPANATDVIPVDLSQVAKIGESGVIQVIARVSDNSILYQCGDVVVAAAGTTIAAIPSSSAAASLSGLSSGAALVALAVSALVI